MIRRLAFLAALTLGTFGVAQIGGMAQSATDALHTFADGSATAEPLSASTYK